MHFHNLLFKKHFTIVVYAIKYKETHICILKSTFLEQKQITDVTMEMYVPPTYAHTHAVIIQLSNIPCIDIKYLVTFLPIYCHRSVTKTFSTRTRKLPVKIYVIRKRLPCVFPNSQKAMVFQSLHLSEALHCPE
jgi:hypothetical protein